MFIYERFDELIHQTGITKASIARRLNRTPTVCQDWKAKKSEPNPQQLAIVASILRTTPEYLQGLTDDKRIPTAGYNGEESALDARLNALLSQADDGLKQAMIAFLEKFQSM